MAALSKRGITKTGDTMGDNEHPVMTITKYVHHGQVVYAMEGLKGLHRDHCLCFQCARFNLEDPEHNCKRAALLYALCRLLNMVTPVWECADYSSKCNWDELVKLPIDQEIMETEI